MSIIEALKKGILEQFGGAVTVGDMFLSLLLAGVLALFIIVIYRKTFSGIVYNRSFTLTTLMLTLVTAMVIRTINSNLSLSLGMVGALSIVRFRTAIKEPLDTAFLFWAIACGIMCGAGLYFMAVLSCLLVGLFFYLFFTTDLKRKGSYLLVILLEERSEADVEAFVGRIKERKLKSRSANAKGQIELTYEVHMDDTEVLRQLQKIGGVSSVSLIECQNDIGL